MNPAEREKILATRSEQQRLVLQEKLREFESLAPTEREARLCSVQLRLYLRPLLELAPSNRLERLAAVPQPDQKLVEERLKIWDQLEAPFQREFLTNEWLLRYIFRPEPARPNQSPAMPDSLRTRIEKGIADWNNLPEARRGEILESFQRLFELNEKEKAKVLNEFSETERQRMQATLQTFEQLPKAQRERCVNGFQKFAGLSPQERQQFLSNVELWQSMSGSDRQAWRSLVTRMSSHGPPLPPPTPPPLPRVPPKTSVLVTTNSY